MGTNYIFGCLLVLFTVGAGSKILIMVPMSSQSHYNVFIPIIEELANRNHDVTVQSVQTLKQPHANVKELKITVNELLQSKAFAKEIFLGMLNLGPIGLIRIFAPFMKQMCTMYINDATTKALIAAGLQYDVVIIDALIAECPTAVASLVGRNVINLYTSSWFPWKEDAAPTPPSYVPVFTALMPSKMDFYQRFQNAINLIGLRYVNRYELEPLQHETIAELLPQAGAREHIHKKVVFAITNGDPVVTSPRPTMPNMVHCGGMHCKKSEPLPKNLNDFVESSGDDGFIIFGLGSGMKSEYLSTEERQSVLSAFARLKQKVIWKFEAELENLPKNVKIMKWMPQQDLLGHPKARLFITHSGLLSIQEAIYHGIPVVGLPLFADQRGNIIRMKELGIGEHVDFLNLTADGFYKVITKVLNDKSYYENMKKYSAIFKDQPERPVDRAVFWIEYVIRHDGARHFRSAAEELNFLQYFLLDVGAFISLIAVSGFGVLVYVVRFALKKYRSKKSSKKEFEKKRN